MNKSALEKQEGGDHYKKLVIQPLEYCQKNHLDYAESNVIKYVTRWKNKGGIEDLKKAIHCLEYLIELEANNQVVAPMSVHYQSDLRKDG